MLVLLGFLRAGAAAPLQSAPDPLEALERRGELLAAKGDDAAALAAFDQVLRRDPNYPRTLHLRAQLHNRRGNWDAAIADASRCLKLRRPEQDFSGTLYVRMRAYQGKGEFEKMLADGEEALRQSPKSSAAFDNRGAAYFSLGNYDKALADYSRALAIDPRNATALRNRAAAQMRREAYAAAVADCTAALALKPDSSTLLWMRGASLSHLGKWREATADLNAALAAKPTDADAHSAFGWMLATAPEGSVRNAEGALAHANRACELSAWSDADKLDTLAAACAEAGRFSEAVSWQQKALAALKHDRHGNAKKFAARLRLYQQDRPYREPVMADERSQRGEANGRGR